MAEERELTAEEREWADAVMAVVDDYAITSASDAYDDAFDWAAGTGPGGRAGEARGRAQKRLESLVRELGDWRARAEKAEADLRGLREAP